MEKRSIVLGFGIHMGIELLIAQLQAEMACQYSVGSVDFRVIVCNSLYGNSDYIELSILRPYSETKDVFGKSPAALGA